jgi:uncharacterized protein
MAMRAAWAASGALLLASAGAGSASFDCARAANAAERLICADPVLSALDEELAQHYATLQAAGRSARLRNDQRAWLATRNDCRDAPCVAAQIERRLAVLACDDAHPAQGSAIGTAACAQAELRVLDRALGSSAGLAAWRQTRSADCRRQGTAQGGAPGWQAAHALRCEVEAARRRLDAAR